jgi:3-hydroxyisobutyrate dehydrogenase-like beta-hydroxyacid dehydrogenase
MAAAHDTRIGFIGLGNMGRPMAARLIAAGFPLVVHDANREAATQLLHVGVSWADTPRKVAEQSDVICTSLPGPIEAEAVFFGEQGILEGAQSGIILVDFTTNSFELVRKMHDALQERCAGMLDAPVSGGIESANCGELTILVGGDAATLNRVRPILDHLAKAILRVGSIGTASICKALHNCAVFCANLATIECLTAGVKAGVDAATLIDVFQKSGLGRNLDLQVAMPATMFRGNFQPRFAMKTARKDMGLATEIARAVDVQMPMAELCEAQMAEAIRRGWGDQDNTIFLTLQEERAGIAVRLTNEDRPQQIAGA